MTKCTLCKKYFVFRDPPLKCPKCGGELEMAAGKASISLPKRVDLRLWFLGGGKAWQ